jgi:mRNA interferase RelE/StbE
VYSIVVSRGAEKDLERLDKSVFRRIATAIDGLALDPRPAGCKKLKGSNEPLWRIRVGDYRVVYSIGDEICVVDIRRVRHRKEVYE